MSKVIATIGPLRPGATIPHAEAIHAESERCALIDRVRTRTARRDALRLMLLATGVTALAARNLHAQSRCAIATRTPIEGPYFYGTPEPKTDTGEELRVTGTVRDSNTCQPIAGATIVRWHANDFGTYEEYYRATMTTGPDGTFAMTTIKPGTYAQLDPHIHWLVSAPGKETVIAQLQWPDAIPDSEVFDFVLTST